MKDGLSGKYNMRKNSYIVLPLLLLSSVLSSCIKNIRTDLPDVNPSFKSFSNLVDESTFNDSLDAKFKESKIFMINEIQGLKSSTNYQKLNSYEFSSYQSKTNQVWNYTLDYLNKGDNKLCHISKLSNGNTKSSFKAQNGSSYKSSFVNNDFDVSFKKFQEDGSLLEIVDNKNKIHTVKTREDKYEVDKTNFDQYVVQNLNFLTSYSLNKRNGYISSNNGKAKYYIDGGVFTLLLTYPTNDSSLKGNLKFQVIFEDSNVSIKVLDKKQHIRYFVFEGKNTKTIEYDEFRGESIFTRKKPSISIKSESVNYKNKYIPLQNVFSLDYNY